MKILVINSGSSSIKYQLLDMNRESVLVNGLVERIGESCGLLNGSIFPGKVRQKHFRMETNIADHTIGMKLLIEQISDRKNGVILDASEIDAVGHRVVHGGEYFKEPALIDEEVLRAIEDNISLAPLHNPANLEGIRVAKAFFPGVPQVAVFDTAFHQSLPPQAYLYALPYRLYEQDRIRRYGFHGTSHKYVAGECARLLGRPLKECNLITLHLGNGCSVTALQNGRSVETSLGMTPLEGLIMGTRCGDIDPALHGILHHNKGMDLKEIDTMLNRESGLKGLCGMNDMRDIHAARQQGDSLAQMAFDMFVYRIKKYIGSYFAVLGRVDAVVFTAGIGENDRLLREAVVAGLEGFGMDLDRKANNRPCKSWIRISTPESRVKVLVVHTDEELEIARQTRDISIHSLVAAAGTASADLSGACAA